MIRFVNVGKKFMNDGKTVRVFEDINLEIKPGEVIGVCGPSGVGKSTLLHLLGLMEDTSSGTIELFGTKSVHLDSDGRAELRNRNIGLMFQFHYLMPDFTVIENIMMPLWIRDGMGAGAGSTDAVVAQLGIGELLGRYPSELSGGEQQRVALARALVNGPRLILADEPTGNLDDENSEVVSGLLIEQARRRNSMLVIATHDTELAGRTDRILRIHEGKVTED